MRMWTCRVHCTGDWKKTPHRDEIHALSPFNGAGAGPFIVRYAAKGCSVIMYRSKDIRKYQIFACTDTTAYTLINPTVLSTKSGGPMAGAWAILNFLGEEGYMRIIKEVQEATKKLMDGINAIDGLQVLGEPAMCMFSFKSDVINVYQLADAMSKRG
jgi:sphinganine-1-phosphate aldolase